jgi:hypothetical protein
MTVSIFDGVEIQDGNLEVTYKFNGIKNPEKFKEFMKLEIGNLSEKLLSIGLVEGVSTSIETKLEDEIEEQDEEYLEEDNFEENKYEKVLMENIDKIIIAENVSDDVEKHSEDFRVLIENVGLSILDKFVVKRDFKSLEKGDEVIFYMINEEIFLISKVVNDFVYKPFVISDSALEYAIDFDNENKEVEEDEEVETTEKKIKENLEDIVNLLSLLEKLKNL